jgi:hypothetical protein
VSEVVITGNPLSRSDNTNNVSSLSGMNLTQQGQSTLGETLNNLPGVSSTYFGPNASRPIVRGLDGDRIRVLSNSGASLDASSLSYDHAVPLDVLSVERIEVLRGPAALQYGGSAIGGVVNVIDNRIPRKPMQGVLGKIQLQGASGNQEVSKGALLETGFGSWVLHADAFDRNSKDVKVPQALACTKPGSPELAKRICNSANNASGGALGASLFFDQGFVGWSLQTYKSQYGTVAEDEVTIGMKSDRAALEGAWRPTSGSEVSIGKPARPVISTPNLKVLKRVLCLPTRAMTGAFSSDTSHGKQVLEPGKAFGVGSLSKHDSRLTDLRLLLLSVTAEHKHCLPLRSFHLARPVSIWAFAESKCQFSRWAIQIPVSIDLNWEPANSHLKVMPWPPHGSGCPIGV